MNRLQLCQKVQRKVRADQGLLGTTPTTATSQTGLLQEIVKCVDDAYEEIQAEQSEWAFRVAQGTFGISSSTRTYSRATIQGSLSTYDQWLPFNGQYRNAHLICYLTATGVADSSPVFYVPYEAWRGFYDVGTRPSGKPQQFTELPDRTLEFDPTPDAAYTVSLDYRKTLDTFSLDADEPIIPEQFHDAIVWWAIEKFWEVRPAQQASLQTAQRNRRREMTRLRVEQLPAIVWRTDLLYGPGRL